MIVLGECSLVNDGLHKYMAPLGYLFYHDKNYIAIMMFAGSTLCMFIAYTYYGLFNFRLSKFYGLFPHKQTDPSSLVYSASIAAKLAFPICYNYLLLVSLLTTKGNIHQKGHKTVFEEVMGAMDLVPILGQDFQKYFPCIIFVFLILNLLEVYSTFNPTLFLIGRVMKALMLENCTFILDISYSKFSLGFEQLNNERKRLNNELPNSRPSVRPLANTVVRPSGAIPVTRARTPVATLRKSLKTKSPPTTSPQTMSPPTYEYIVK